MRLFGHPVHPMLVHFPVALWSIATFCDLAVVSGFTRLGSAEAALDLWLAGTVAMAAGALFALPAMVAGFFDLAKLVPEAERTGTRHMIAMGLAWTLYLASLVTRYQKSGLLDPSEAGMLTIALSIAAFLAMAAGAKLGGDLVYRFGAGVEKD